MPLRSLLLCRERATIQLLIRGFKEAGIDVVPCSEAEQAQQTLKNDRFEAVVLDADDREQAMLLLDSLKTTSKNSLKIVLADSRTALSAAFSTGTHLVIYKPLSQDRLRKSIGAVCNLMGRKHQRIYPRIRVRVPANIHIDNRALPATMLDISEGGAALSTQSLPMAKTVALEFVIPGTTGAITTSAEVVWKDVRGRFGAQFVGMEANSKKLLSQWLVEEQRANPPAKAGAAKYQA